MQNGNETFVSNDTEGNGKLDSVFVSVVVSARMTFFSLLWSSLFAIWFFGRVRSIHKLFPLRVLNLSLRLKGKFSDVLSSN